MLCAGTTSGELCGADFKMSTYEIKHDVTIPGSIGCYKDASDRAMNAEEKHEPGDMTNEVSARYQCMLASYTIPLVVSVCSNSIDNNAV